MHSALEPQPHHRVLHHKMKDSFTPIYLTVLSVIQGVTLADLALGRRYLPSCAVRGFRLSAHHLGEQALR